MKLAPPGRPNKTSIEMKRLEHETYERIKNSVTVAFHKYILEKKEKRKTEKKTFFEQIKNETSDCFAKEFPELQMDDFAFGSKSAWP